LKLKLLISSHSYINKKTTTSTTVDSIKELSSDIKMKINAHTETPLVHKAARQITASIRIVTNTILSQAPKNRQTGRQTFACKSRHQIIYLGPFDSATGLSQRPTPMVDHPSKTEFSMHIKPR
jgi:hypothetical protein